MLAPIIHGPPLPPLKLLGAAMRLEGRQRLCIHRSAAFVLDVPGAVLVFGTLKPDDVPQPGHSTVPFIHSWAEYRGNVYAPTTIERMDGHLVPVPRDTYYAINGAHDIHSLTRAALLRLDKRYGLKRALRQNVLCRGGASFGGTLLDAAGVAWADDNGGVVPPYVLEGAAK